MTADKLTRLRRIAARQAELRVERDQLIRELLADKIRVTDIADAAGLRRARVYQIRDGVR